MDESTTIAGRRYGSLPAGASRCPGSTNKLILGFARQTAFSRTSDGATAHRSVCSTWSNHPQTRTICLIDTIVACSRGVLQLWIVATNSVGAPPERAFGTTPKRAPPAQGDRPAARAAAAIGRRRVGGRACLQRGGPPRQKQTRPAAAWFLQSRRAASEGLSKSGSSRGPGRGPSHPEPSPQRGVFPKSALTVFTSGWRAEGN